jgi:hypothetical protein
MDQSPLSRLYALRISSVGARSGWWTYSALQIFRKKYDRSSAFANPASWEVLCNRTSNTFLTFDLRIRSKKSEAVVFVKPIVDTSMLFNAYS